MERLVLTRRDALVSLFAFTVPIALLGCRGGKTVQLFQLYRDLIAAPSGGLGVFPVEIGVGSFMASVTGSGLDVDLRQPDSDGFSDLVFGVARPINGGLPLGLNAVKVTIFTPSTGLSDPGESTSTDAQVLVIPSDHKVGLLINRAAALSQTVARGQSQTSPILALAIDDAISGTRVQTGFTGEVALAVTGQGDGVTATLDKTSLSLTPGGDASANVTIQVSATATPGDHELELTGTHADGKVARAPIHLTVSGSPPSPSPSPTPTPAATPTPSPSPSPTPIPGGPDFTISSSTAPLAPGGFVASGGTATREEDGNILRIFITGPGGEIGRYLTIVIRDTSTIGPGHTYPIGGLPLDKGRATVSYQQSGGAPYYQNYIGRASAGTVRIESTSGGAWRVILSGTVLEADPDSPASGSFHLDGSMEVAPPAG